MSCSELDRALHKQVLKREEWKEREFREKKRQHDEEVRLGFGATEMSKEELRKIIDSDRRMYYRTEDLNDKLYIHYKGWRELQGLEGWTGLRALYAECNAFSRIQGLQNCRNLRSLFLSENCIHKIEGLENCPELWSLNLSNNFIERIEGLSKCTRLNTLTIAKNKIGFGGLDDVIELVSLGVNSLDIQDNKISDPDVLPEVFAQMSDLRVLYLKGNPCAKKIPNYRKSLTVYCPEMKYIDDRPVFPDDRRAAEAFNRGGLEEERAERRRIREEASAKHDANMRAFQAMIDAARSEKRERTAMRTEDKYTDDTDPVESQEQRMKRQVDQWKEENAEDLKDDLKERAMRCLASEKSGSATEIIEVEAPHESSGAIENTDGLEEKEKHVDNRKLVYEDIWDDQPASAPSRSRSRPQEAAPDRPIFAPPPRDRKTADKSANEPASRGTDSAPSAATGGSPAGDLEVLGNIAGTAAPDQAATPLEPGKSDAWYAKFARVASQASADTSKDELDEMD